MKISNRMMAFVGLFAAITAVCAQIAIKLPPPFVPITLQLFAVFTAAGVLGKKYGALSQIIYVLLGAAGLPVFSGLGAGLGVLLGPSGGYILSFPVIAWIAGIILEKKALNAWVSNILVVFLGLSTCYLLGTLRLQSVLHISFLKALTIGVLPFVVVDVIKAGIALTIAERVRVATRHLNFEK